MRRGPKTPGVDDLVVAEVNRLKAVVDGEWSLPIVWTRDGDMLSGSVTIGCTADLHRMGIDQAKLYITTMIKQAILSHAHPAEAADEHLGHHGPKARDQE